MRKVVPHFKTIDMKNITKWASMLFIITLLFAGSARANVNNNYSPPNSEITYQQFYNDLSPYGNWINDPQYGYVWSPYESDFQPYRSNGNWAYTRYGWTWVSDYRWGWAPFHYGRWTLDPYYGWLWIPGYDWAPAWVDWRSGGDYYGWAPMGPGYGFNISVNVWNFVPRRYIYSRRLHNYYVNPSRNVVIINNTTIINNNHTTINNGNTGPRRTYNTGPSVREVENVTKARVRTLDVVQSSRPGAASLDGKSIRIYKPEVAKIENENLVARPVRAIELNDVQRKEVLAVRKGTLEKGDLKPTLENNSNGVTRNLNGVNRNINETPQRDNSNAFQDNGIKNSSIDRRQLNTVKPEINNNSPIQEINATPSRSPISGNLNPASQDRPVRNNQIERQQTPVQERSLSPDRQSSSSRNETISREMPQAREMPQTREVPQARREAPQARQEAQKRQPEQTREAPVRRVAPVREAPVRQERVRNLPSRESNSGNNSESPRRVRRGE